MTIAHQNVQVPRPFRPTLKGGGSEKGKPQNYWPWIIKIVCEAVIVRAAGSVEAWMRDRNCPLTLYQIGKQMDQYLPGWLKVRLASENKPSKSDQRKLLKNRVYKGLIYNGSSARGINHDPNTRASFSPENWRLNFFVDGPVGKLYDDIVRGKILTVKNWKRDWMGLKPQKKTPTI